MKSRNNISKRVTINECSFIDVKSYLIAISVSLICTSIFLIIFSLIISKKSIPHAFFSILALIAVSISSFIGSFILSKINKQKGLINGMFLGLIISSIIYIIGIAFNGMTVTNLLYIKFISIIISSCLGGVLGINIKKKNKI